VIGFVESLQWFDFGVRGLIEFASLASSDPSALPNQQQKVTKPNQRCFPFQYDRWHRQLITLMLPLQLLNQALS
jgi:hypothetical protein